MNKKLWFMCLILAIAIVFLVMGVYLFQRSKTVKPPASPARYQGTAVDALDASYMIDGASVALVHGTSEQPTASGSSETITTQIFGEPTYGDVNGDGKNDAAVFLVERDSGSGIFYYAAVALATGTGTLGTNAIFLGDRIAPDTIQIASGTVIVNYADRRATDPMVTPLSVGISKYLVVASGTLYDTPADIYPLPSGLSWNGPRAATMAPRDPNVTSTLIGIRIESEPVTNITNLSAESPPFDAYYKKKLVAEGWIEDKNLAAGGPGAEIIGYRNGSSYIILEYASVFKNVPTDSPETCPCDMTFSVFAGSLER